MHVWTRCATACLLGLMVAGAFSQDDSQKVIVGGPPATLTQQLRLHHVELTESGLTKALQSPNAQVRYLAALTLAEEKDIGAAPAMAEALSREKVPETRINMAIALAQLGEGKGVTELTADCENTALPGYLRLQAVTYFLQSGKRACLGAVLDILDTDPNSRVQALSMLSQYHHLSKEESDQVLQATATCLTDESGAVRLEASEALRWLANSSASPFLQSAIETEKDDVVRSAMEATLQSLQTKKHQ